MASTLLKPALCYCDLKMRPPRAQPTPSIDAPCIRNCCLNERDVCLGCGRNLTEILQWQSFSMEQRGATLRDAEQRRNELKNS